MGSGVKMEVKNVPSNLTDEELVRLGNLPEEFWEIEESIKLVLSIIWQQSRSLYDLNVDGETVSDRLSRIEKKMSDFYSFIGSLKNPLCPVCKVRGKPLIGSFAQMYEPLSIFDDPRAGISRWTGEYFCPKCYHTLSGVKP